MACGLASVCAPLLSNFPSPPSPPTTLLTQDDYGIYEYSEWYNRLCAENGVSRDFVTKKPAPVKQ